MQSTTLRAPTFIAAQITARLLLNGVQAFIVLLIGSLIFHTQVNGSWWLLIFYLSAADFTPVYGAPPSDERRRRLARAVAAGCAARRVGDRRIYRRELYVPLGLNFAKWLHPH